MKHRSHGRSHVLRTRTLPTVPAQVLTDDRVQLKKVVDAITTCIVTAFNAVVSVIMAIINVSFDSSTTRAAYCEYQLLMFLAGHCHNPHVRQGGEEEGNAYKSCIARAGFWKVARLHVLGGLQCDWNRRDE